MATIGFYENSAPDVRFTINGLHVNFWILPTELSFQSILEAVKLRRIHRCFIDIGIRFSTSGDAPPRHFDFLPPARWTISRSFYDLSDKVVDDEVSDLIFGSSVIVSGKNVTYNQSDQTIDEYVLAVDQLQDLRDGRYRVVIQPPPAATKSNSYYLRFRYECGDVSQLFRSKGWGFAKRGWIFDLRVNDIRETVQLPEAIGAERMLPIERCYIFVVAPSAFVPALYSPSLQYTRLLELKVWKKYLDTCRHVGKNTRSSIYYWREERPATNLKPVRTYMHLHREFGFLILAVYGLGIVALPLLSDLLRFAGTWAWELFR